MSDKVDMDGFGGLATSAIHDAIVEWEHGKASDGRALFAVGLRGAASVGPCGVNYDFSCWTRIRATSEQIRALAEAPSARKIHPPYYTELA